LRIINPEPCKQDYRFPCINDFLIQGMELAKTILKIAFLFMLAMAANCGKNGSVETNAPEAPSQLTGEALTSNSVQLAWLDNSDNEAGFIIYRSIPGPYEEAGRTGADRQGYIDTSLPGCSEARYYIVAYKGDNISLPSNRITVPLLCEP
jgi:hypothetical protein